MIMVKRSRLLENLQGALYFLSANVTLFQRGKANFTSSVSTWVEVDVLLVVDADCTQLWLSHFLKLKNTDIFVTTKPNILLFLHTIGRWRNHSLNWVKNTLQSHLTGSYLGIWFWVNIKILNTFIIHKILSVFNF